MVSARPEIERPTCAHCSKPYGIREMDRGVFLGHYYTPHKPFCSLRCGLAYARVAYNAIRKLVANAT